MVVGVGVGGAVIVHMLMRVRVRIVRWLVVIRGRPAGLPVVRALFGQLEQYRVQVARSAAVAPS